MRFQCESCKEVFQHPAKHIHFLEPKDIEVNEDLTIKVGDTIETTVCPFCQSKNYTEYAEPTPAPEEIGNVYIYDLTTGPQTTLDGLLAQGYRIVNRYSKQYHLEKPKDKPTATYGVCTGDCDVCNKPTIQRQIDVPCKTRIALGITTPSTQEMVDMKQAHDATEAK